MSKKLIPLGNRVVIRKEEDSRQTRGGIYLPDIARKEKVVTGEVLAVGPGKWDSYHGGLLPMNVKVGSVVVFSDYSGSKFSMDGSEVSLLEENDVLAILE